MQGSNSQVQVALQHPALAWRSQVVELIRDQKGSYSQFESLTLSAHTYMCDMPKEHRTRDSALYLQTL